MNVRPTAEITGVRENGSSSRRSFGDGWSVRPKTSIFFELGGITAPWQPVTLPHDAVIGAERDPAVGTHTGYYPGGVFEYRKNFDITADQVGRRVAFEFEGVYRDAMVFINDQYVAQRPSGYAGFVVEGTAFLKPGQENSLRVEARAHEDSRWYTGVGIYRDVWMIVTDDLRIAPNGIRVTTPDVDAERAVVHVATTVRNDGPRPRTVRMHSEIRARGGDAALAAQQSPVTVMPGEEAVLRQRIFVAAPRLWSADAPNLYTLVSRLQDGERTIEDATTSFGIRTLQLDPQHGLRINGEVVKLRGACIHHDNGPLGAASFARAEERRVELLKAAGFNAIRSSHNPLSSAMLDACDRLGMLVLDETFDVWAESKSGFDYSLAFPEWWERDVEAMVLKDINHPSVIMYSIGNEILETGDPIGSRWGRLIAEKIRSLDQTRFVTNSINGLASVIRDVASMAQGAATGGVNAVMNDLQEMMTQVTVSPLVSERTEESFSIVDVAGLNYGESRYDLDASLYPERIILGTETSPNQIAENWAKIVASSLLIGDFTWTGWEYLGEAGLGHVAYADDDIPPMSGPFPWRVSGSGDIDITGHRRPVSYYRETVFGLRSDPYVAVHPPETAGRTIMPGKWSWNDAVSTWDWEVQEGTPLTVEVYSDADEVELWVGDRVIGRQPAGVATGFVTTFTAEYANAEVVAIAYTGGVETGRFGLAAPSGERCLALAPDRTRVQVGGGDLSFVSITVEDEHGAVFTDESEQVTVTVEGDGVLQGLGTGRPASDESFTGQTCETFQGRAIAIVRPTGPGEIIVRASTASGLEAQAAIQTVAEPAQPFE